MLFRSLGLLLQLDPLHFFLRLALLLVDNDKDLVECEGGDPENSFGMRDALCLRELRNACDDKWVLESFVNDNDDVFRVGEEGGLQLRG